MTEAQLAALRGLANARRALDEANAEAWRDGKPTYDDDGCERVQFTGMVPTLTGFPESAKVPGIRCEIRLEKGAGE